VLDAFGVGEGDEAGADVWRGLIIGEEQGNRVELPTYFRYYYRSRPHPMDKSFPRPLILPRNLARSGRRALAILCAGSAKIWCRDAKLLNLEETILEETIRKMRERNPQR
jgi:hypothetical protein